MDNHRPVWKRLLLSAAIAIIVLTFLSASLSFLSTSKLVSSINVLSHELSLSAFTTKQSASTSVISSRRRLATTKSSSTKTKVITVYTQALDTPIARKQQQDLNAAVNNMLAWDDVSNIRVDLVRLTLEQQRSFIGVHKCGSAFNVDDVDINKAAVPAALKRFDDMVERKQEHLATELWKYCALSLPESGEGQDHVHVFLDASSPLLTTFFRILTMPFASNNSVAVLGDVSYFSQTIHGSLLALRYEQRHIASKMMQVLVDTSLDVLESSPLLIPRTLYALISVDRTNTVVSEPLEAEQNGENWYLLTQTCHINPLRRSEATSWMDPNSYRLAHHCPLKSGFCCSIHDSFETILMTSHPIFPYQLISDNLKKPYNAEAGHFEEEELPFFSTIREEVFRRPEEYPATPNFFDTLIHNDCLPTELKCTKCLRNKGGANCKSCGKECACYCKTLCHEKVETKFVAKKLYVKPPLFSRDPNRLVPRIVHQTWFEDLSAEKYPNMSRLAESFRRSGWEYRFYSDDEAANFLSTHFPAEIREAYDALIPGAFKADLFRYCVLLIHGGVYADVDIMLESSLDFAVAPDVGFMVPIDEPGLPVKRPMCLWNGLIAAAPGHPFLLKAVETVVNQVRNRFTSVDTDASFCPAPELSILHAYDTLFPAGPCLLGASINRVLGRHGMTSFLPGELALKEEIKSDAEKNLALQIPGRTVILHQNKWDMGAHRFTHLEQNLVIAATDLPDSNDREKLENEEKGTGGGVHYSKTHAKTGIYGLEGLYTDKKQANEDIRLYLDHFREPQRTAVVLA